MNDSERGETSISIQKQLFEELGPPDAKAIPNGFKYQPNFISKIEERELVTALHSLDLKPFEFHGHQGNRRVISFGLRYNFAKRGVERAASPPDFLYNLRQKVADLAGYAANDFVQIGVNEYSPGAGIGWHRDKAEFGTVVGVSLLSLVKMRFRKSEGDAWARFTHELEPRSLYILSGEIRELWEHSIAPVTSLRYSLTFRTLAPSSKSK
jgi:alkylated DNA repair dioxygenase AlkB